MMSQWLTRIVLLFSVSVLGAGCGTDERSGKATEWLYNQYPNVFETSCSGEPKTETDKEPINGAVFDCYVLLKDGSKFDVYVVARHDGTFRK